MKTLGKDHPDTAACYGNIGNAYISIGKLNEAIKYNEKSLENKLKTLGKDNSKIGDSYDNIGFGIIERLNMMRLLITLKTLLKFD